MTEVKQKKCYRKCPQCGKTADAIGVYESTHLKGYLKTKCPWCNFVQEEYVSADPLMQTYRILKPENTQKKLSTVDAIDAPSGSDMISV